MQESATQGWEMPQTYEELEDQIIKTARGSGSFRRMVREIFQMRRDSAALVTTVLITAIAGTLYPLMLGFAVNAIIARNVFHLELFASLFFLLYLVQFFSNRIRTISSTVLAQKEIKSLRDRAFQSLQYVPEAFYSKVKTGYLISRITNDAETLSEFLTFQLPSVIAGISTVIVSISIMFYKDFNLTLYALIIIPVLMAFTISIQPRVRQNYLRTRKTIAAITGNLAENISAIRTIKAFNVEKRTEDNFRVLNDRNFRANMKASRLSSAYGASVRIIEAAGIAIVLLAGALQLIHGVTSVGILVAFVVYVQEFFDPVIQLSQLYNSYQSSLVGISRIYGIIDQPKDKEPEESESQVQFKDSIVIKGMSFSYGEGNALENIHLTIRKGEKVAVVGHTGAGKTTLSNLLLKFYRPEAGGILIDGRDLSSISTRSYRKLMTPVLQDPFLFRGTVLENIIFVDPGITREHVLELISRFGLADIFSSLPQGIDTNVGEMGRNLSEGQRQAVSILRAFARDPEILILDEPTSQIDPYSEKLIIEALREFVKEKTLILITHRFSMIVLVDRVVVLKDGSIAEEGTFKELMKKEGLFSSLYNIQYGDA